ncbi:hypothetical protein PAXINDRAFT_18954 [Paxillus involutus ATCC 200175]|uniref:Uncharacterized protein n=1 Tax=Paxillus involutus ATCC 200175 TaxID=664439 RepID=A0A0C9SXT0_PAXIN|nr:hypothetical protein PAXINDRAFT_18954 [Paxillus involutus ATCC 200175]
MPPRTSQVMQQTRSSHDFRSSAPWTSSTFHGRSLGPALTILSTAFYPPPPSPHDDDAYISPTAPAFSHSSAPSMGLVSRYTSSQLPSNPPPFRNSLSADQDPGQLEELKYDDYQPPEQDPQIPPPDDDISPFESTQPLPFDSQLASTPCSSDEPGDLAYVDEVSSDEESRAAESSLRSSHSITERQPHNSSSNYENVPGNTSNRALSNSQIDPSLLEEELGSQNDVVEEHHRRNCLPRTPDPQ